MRFRGSIRTQQLPAADPMTGPRAAIWLAAAALGIALGLNVGLPLPHPALAPRGQAQSNQAEVAVLLFPDLEGDGDFAPDCPGCDGAFSSGDRLLAVRNPLPRLDVTLTDHAGTELTMRTRVVAPGRQETLFRVDQPGAYTVTLRSLPPEWQLCPMRQQDHTVVAADFDATTRRAAVLLALARGCQRPSAGTPPTADPAGAITEPAAAATPTTVATVWAPAAPIAATEPAPSASDAATNRANDDGANGDGDAAAPGPLDGVAGDASVALMLPQTGLAGGAPIRRPAGFALLALAAAALGAGGRHLFRRPLSQRSGRRPKPLR